MDTSETNIKMCEKAEKIQEIWHSKELRPDKRYRDARALAKHYAKGYEGSWVIQDDKYIILVDYEYETAYKGNDIWLPTQCQLQEMLLNPPNTLCPDILTMLRLFNIFASVNPQFTSMEQLWLAFVMREKYNKVWNGEDWIKDG